MVLEIIREKDQADFRGVRGDFTSRAGGGSIEVSWTHSEFKASLVYITSPGQPELYNDMILSQKRVLLKSLVTLLSSLTSNWLCWFFHPENLRVYTLLTDMKGKQT